MAAITFTPDGIVREGVICTDFFNSSRATLLGGGFDTTAWVDYVIGQIGEVYVFVTIEKDRLLVEFSPFREKITTTDVQEVLDLLK